MRRRIRHIPIDLIQEFDILNKNGSGTLSAIIKDELEARIQRVTKSPWSHTAIAVRDLAGNMWWYEAIAEGFVKSPMSKYCDPDVTVNSDIVDLTLFRMKQYLTEREKDTMRLKANKYVGRKYAWEKLLGALWQLVWKTKHNPVKGTRLICSEAVAKIYKAAGIYLTPNSPRTTYPSHIAKSVLLKTIV